MPHDWATTLYSNSKGSGVDTNTMESMLYQMAAKTEQVINTVASELPMSFPAFISEPIFERMHRYSQRLLS